jgi:tight adherence protein C
MFFWLTLLSLSLGLLVFKGGIFLSEFPHRIKTGENGTRWQKVYESLVDFFWKMGYERERAVFIVERVFVFLTVFLCGIMFFPPFLKGMFFLFLLLSVLLLKQKYVQQENRVFHDMIDISRNMALAVSVGQDIWKAMETACQFSRGPFSAACQDFLMQRRLGKNSVDLFEKVQRRYPVSRDFFSSLEMAEKQGVSLAKVLREQATHLAGLEMLRTEARSQKLPVFLLGPLCFCIFPNIFVVLLGPYLLDFF